MKKKENVETPILTDVSEESKISPNKESSDLFNLNRLRLGQNFNEISGVKKVLLTIPVRKPDRQWFIQTHPDESMRICTAVLEFKEDGGIFLVDRPLWGELAAEISPTLLQLSTNRQNILFFWPIKLPREDGKHNEWNRSALEACELARNGWVRVVSNMTLGSYEVYQATGQIPPPEWPVDKNMEELLKIAFQNRFITDPSHPIIARLRGEK